MIEELTVNLTVTVYPITQIEIWQPRVQRVREHAAIHYS